ncbi:MAG: cold shock domain-containing protein, partial [Cyanobacteriota bacterium]
SPEYSGSRSSSPNTSVTSVTKPECNIKGNISVGTGNKIYHVPGAEDYESTRIDPASGEKWFCTEAEAIANGWRKSPR